MDTSPLILFMALLVALPPVLVWCPLPMKHAPAHHILRLGVFLLVVLAVRPGWAGTYATSAHAGSGTPDNGLSRIATTAYATGSCAHCHEQHASIDGSEPNPTGGPDPYLGMELEQNLCQACHTASGSVSDSIPTPNNIKTDITKTYSHAGTLSDSLHRANENFDNFTASAHVECTDCHNPHVARKGNHTAGNRYQTASGNLIANSTVTGASPLEGVSGATQGYGGASTSWSTPSQASYTLQTATKEYEICYKCHSGANANLTSWDNAEVAVFTESAAWTDTGLEFNPNNASYHPIVQASPHPLNSAQLANGWAPGDTMYCSDCHAGDSTAAGPHGSASKWMLVGTYKNWPFTLATDNGISSGGTYASINGVGTSTTFCHNCHPTVSTNDTHAENSHWGSLKGRCTNCHIRVPHGGKADRLTNANFSGTMPSRYTPDGIGGGYGNYGPIEKFLRSTAHTSYAKSNCRASGSGCSDHNSQNPATTEYW
jgi:hypothetical protein